MPSPGPSSRKPVALPLRPPSGPRPTRLLRAGAAERPVLQPWTIRSASASETRRIGAALGRALRGGEVLALYGDLGSGKTALVGGIAAGLGAPPRTVSSPTFVFIQCYEARLRLAHADLYRLESPAALDALGLSEWMDGRTVVAIEWAEKGGGNLPDDRLEIHLSHRGKTRREIRLLPRGVTASTLGARVRRSYRTTPRPRADSHRRAAGRRHPAGRHAAPRA